MLCLHICSESRQHIARKLHVTMLTPRTLWTRTPREDTTPTRRLAPESIGANLGKLGSPASGRACISEQNQEVEFTSCSSAVRMQAGEFHGVGHHISRLKDEVTSVCLRDPRARGQLGVMKHYSRPGGMAQADTSVSVGRDSRATGVLSVPNVAGRPVSRIPRVYVSAIRWEMGISAALSPEFRWPKGLKELTFAVNFKDSLKGVVFPETLETLSFGFSFNQSLAHGQVLWPRALKRLYLGMKWDQPMHSAKASWPESLEELYFGALFNQPLVGDVAGLPRGLRKINLGGVFDYPLVGLEWPPRLQSLELSHCFSQRLDDVVFPKSLEEIILGETFNQPIDGVTWPPLLKNLVFGGSFNQRIDGATWPAALRQLALGYEFNKGIGRGVWPAALLRLTLGRSFNQSIEKVVWPASLEKLRLGENFNQPIEEVAWPGSLRILVFADASEFDHGVSRVVWPPRLEELRFGNRFNQPLEGCSLPATLRKLRLGLSFTYSLKGVLPHGLQLLLLSRSYPISRLDELSLPPSLLVTQWDECKVMGWDSFFDEVLQ